MTVVDERYVYPYGLKPSEIHRVAALMARLCVETYRNPDLNSADRVVAAQKLVYVTELVYGFDNLKTELVRNLDAVGANPLQARIFASMAADPSVYDAFIPRELTNGNDQALLKSILAEAKS